MNLSLRRPLAWLVPLCVLGQAVPAQPVAQSASATRGVSRGKTHAISHAHVKPAKAHSSGKRVSHRTTPTFVYSREDRERAVELVASRFESKPDAFVNPRALQPFFDSLASAKTAHTPIHVLQFGDSHTASDDWSDEMRKQFQAVWGIGGPGFIAAGHPYRGYRRFDATGSSSPGWKTQGTLGSLGDGRSGLAGVSIEADRPNQTVTLTVAADRLELIFLRQPGGGSFDIRAEGAYVATLSTEGPLGTGTYTIPAASGTHTYTITTRSYAPVRLFGWAADNDRGITWETLGINGAQAGILLRWDELIWAEQMAARKPALVVLAYGTNEAFYPLFNLANYRSDLMAVVQRVKQVAPDASVLLVGPPDCDHHRPFPHLAEIIETQQSVAQETNSAFWNWAAHMDESGGRAVWVQAGLSQPDFTHLTGSGYRLLGRILAEDLMKEYQRLVPPADSVQQSLNVPR